jgi:hypothetical protein
MEKNQEFYLLVLIGATVVGVILLYSLGRKKVTPPYDPSLSDLKNSLREKAANLLDIPDKYDAQAFEDFKDIFTRYKTLEKFEETLSKNGKQPDEN